MPRLSGTKAALSRTRRYGYTSSDSTWTLAGWRQNPTARGCTSAASSWTGTSRTPSGATPFVRVEDRAGNDGHVPEHGQAVC